MPIRRRGANHALACQSCEHRRSMLPFAFVGRSRRSTRAEVQAKAMAALLPLLRCSQCGARDIAEVPEFGVLGRAAAEPLALQLRHERMNGIFEKWHLAGLPVPLALHHFTGPDHGDPHDHPWGFRSTILSGGYVEEVFHVGPAGQWHTEVIERPAQSQHVVPAAHIHRIIGLIGDACWTAVRAGADERETRFWRFEPGRVRSRAWHQRRFSLHR